MSWQVFLRGLCRDFRISGNELAYKAEGHWFESISAHNLNPCKTITYRGVLF